MAAPKPELFAEFLRGLGPEFSLRLLQPEQLEEILSDLGPEFSVLSNEGRSALRNEINFQFHWYEISRKTLSDAAPHKRIAECERLARALKTVKEILGGFGFDLEYALDRWQDHPRATRPPTQQEVVKAAAEDIELAASLERCRKEFLLHPSTQAIADAKQIKNSVDKLALLTKNIIIFNDKRKNKKRKYDHDRDNLIVELAMIYEKYFKIEAKTCREGKWPTFLSGLLSILEDE